ncbi:sugar-binding transcriptional regulator [Streptococcus orisasini]|uniref:sugar-binding transcriptional regulator n=1 Tax=Streptococcus orisasini TaxID=1080071 RepID=UPI00070EB02A|nr:sugar-binding transcriptional regulator [Streptococcus orisasini]
MNKERRRLLAKTAYLYYIEGKSQAEISEEMDIYRTTVSRMLHRARAEGIVQISIKDYDSDLFALEEYIRQKYGLKKVELVADQFDDTLNTRLNNIAQTAAELVKASIKNEDTVGISWGASLSKVIDQIGTKTLDHVNFCPLTGGPSHINARYHVNTLVYRISRAFHGKGNFINAMAVQESASLAQGICRSKYFNTISDLWSHLDMAIVGIGGELTESDASQWRDLLTKKDYDILHKEKAVGEMCCRFFDENGNTVHQGLQDRTVGLSLEEFAAIPKTIAVACGENKAAAILAILRKKYINHLVTDKSTILKVLELDQDLTHSIQNKIS